MSEGQLHLDGIWSYPVEDGKILRKGESTLGKTYLRAERPLYHLEIKPPLLEEIEFVETKAKVPLELMHQRFAHCSYHRLIGMSKNKSVHGLHVTSHVLPDCVYSVCRIAKSKSLPHVLPSFSEKHELLDVICADYKGPMEILHLIQIIRVLLFM